ncbi:MAG: L-serine ammonia-lyase, iron-sulfur-dependent, subunit alpha [Sphaerochaeta sp.]|jgi:L-cysteine desulfidase|nr:L-serine ammonia-lyase, iron-sulfur-dependent, subunit alpha [Sphaerochaeta sp.]MDX9915841.1 L-serine ammonia-lyase, iron-sulfur-dependent, subunit alpha [Sphaerochaeta sp.]
MDHYLLLLKKEMREAMGCTEPAASALAGAKAAELLGQRPVLLEVTTSRDMVKNAMGVGLPNCSLKGIQAAVALGACGGEVEAGLSILSTLSDEQVHCASMMPVSLTLASDIPPLYIKVRAVGGSSSATAVISGEHDRFSHLAQGGTVLLDLPVDACGATLEADDEQFLGSSTLSEILAWVDNAPAEALALVRWAKETNMAIARHGMEHPWGLSVGRVATEGVGEITTLQEAFAHASAMAASASDARMAGCPLGVVINSGSGNQGIMLTVPLAVVGSYLGTDDDSLAKAMLVAQLVGLSLTARKNRLSALCGAFTAAIGTACGYVHLLGGGLVQMDQAFNTMVGNLTGIICDGAKGTCALKIHSCAEAAALAAKLAMKGLAPSSESGIVGRTSAESMDFLQRISREGMEEIDKTILSIMMGKHA